MATHDINVNGTIANDAVTNAKLANAPEATFKLVPVGSGTSNPIDGDADQAMEILALATDPPLTAADLAGYVQDGQTLSTGLVFPYGGLRVKDNAGSQELAIVVGEDLTANRTLTLIVNDANKTLELTGDAEISGVNTGDDASDPAGSAAAAEIAAKAYADGLVVGLFDDRGNWDASGNVFPATGGSGTAGAVLKGDVWRVSVAGTLGGELADVGDSFRALVDTPGQTASNWALFAANTQQATESVRGTAAIATQAEAEDSASTNDIDIVTPKKWWQAFVAGLNTTRLGSVIHAATDKATPVDADELPLVDSAASNVLKKLTWANLKATLFGSPALTGTPTAPTPAAGTNTTQIATTAFVHERPMGMHVHSAATWTNMPAAATFIIGVAGAAVTKLVPTGSFTQVRYVVATGTVAGASGAKLYVRYRSTYSATASDYLLMGATEVECAINSTNTGVDSGWINLVAGAIGDIYVTVLGSGGDGAIDPVFGTGTIYFR